MSGTQGKVGEWKLDWKSVPRGPEGSAMVQAGDGPAMEVRWRRDEDGLWVEFPHGVYGFDIAGRESDDGGVVYHVAQRASSLEWDGLKFVRAGEERAGPAAGGKKKSTRVRAQMPGKIVRILVKPGDEVVKDQPLLVMEAMKMENQIRATGPGKVSTVKVNEGQTVESGADLVLID